MGASSPLVTWLLHDNTPGVQYLTRLHLLGESPRSRTMTTLRRRCNDYPPVAKMLDRVKDFLPPDNGEPARKVRWADYQKYRGAYWTFIFLADLYADRRDPRIQNLARHVLATQLENGGFSCDGKPHFEIVCLTANILRALVHFGFGRDERVVHGYHRLADRILPHGGVPCPMLDYCLQTACKMTLPQTLRCHCVAPRGAAAAKMKQTREVLVRDMLSVKVYQYVRPDVKEFRQAVRSRPAAVKEREVRAEWLKTHRVAKDRLLPKPGWLRFGFPNSYNPDLLEAMLALAELGVKHDAAMDDALDHIEKKRGKDGRWKLDASLNGKMHANVERKGYPSRWVTYRALRVLADYGRVTI